MTGLEMGGVWDVTKVFRGTLPVGQIKTPPVMAYYLKACIYHFNEQKLKHATWLFITSAISNY
jgi:hypothetical protein